MKRTPEPELMDDEAQALAYAQADFSAEDAAFVARLLDTFELAGTVVDLGCGPGNIALRVAAATDCAVVGVDGAEAMLRHARDLAGRFGDRVRFIRAQLPAVGLPRADAVVSNSLLHHLHEPAVLWQTIGQIGRPGAPVFVGDLRRPGSVAEAEAIVQRYAADDPPVLQRDFLASLHAAFTPDEVRAQLTAAGLALQVEPIDDRHLLVWGRLPCE